MNTKSPSQLEFTPPSRAWAVICAACGLPVFFALAYLGWPDKGIIATFSIMMIMGVVRTTWRLRRRFWYWPILGAFIFIHAIVAYEVHFPHFQFALLIFFPVFATDFAAMLIVFWFAEKSSTGRAPSKNLK